MKTNLLKFRVTVLFLICILLFSACENKKESSITLFSGGIILTVDTNFNEVEAIAIDGNKIIATGKLKDVQKKIGKNYKSIDLKGKVLLPGFIDPHFHIVGGGVVDLTMDYVGMERFKTTNEVLTHIAEQVKEATPGQWIGLRGWDPALQEGPSALTFKELDSISTDNPIFVLNASGHLAYANSKAFELASITNDIENPEGAEYMRDKNGRLTGAMENLIAFMPVWITNPEAQNAHISKAIAHSTEVFSKRGFTTLSELALGSFLGNTSEIDTLFKAAESGKLKTRIRAYPAYVIEKSMDSSTYKPNFGNDLVKLSGFKLVADGSNQGFTGLQRDAYHCCVAGHGRAYTNQKELNRLVEKYGKQGWQLAIHGNGDQGIDNILNALETASNKGIKLIRPRIEHSSILHDEQIQRMKELGVSASFLIGHVHYWGTFMRDNVFGPEKVLLLDRAASVNKAGIGFTLHSDFPVTNPNPMHMIEMAVTRKTWKEPDYVLVPDERVSVELAIRAITSEAAWQLMSDKEIGSLEVGKLADLVILDNDPRKVNPDSIKNIEVLETWMNGVKMN